MDLVVEPGRDLVVEDIDLCVEGLNRTMVGRDLFVKGLDLVDIRKDLVELGKEDLELVIEGLDLVVEGIEVEVMVQFKDASVTPPDYKTNVESLLTDWEDRAMVKLLGSLKIGMNDSVYMMKYTGRFRISFSCVDKCRMPLLNNGQVL